jgi:NitT/TauT family transport system permease protein
VKREASAQAVLPGGLVLWQIAVGACLLAGWEVFGLAREGAWVSRPSLVGGKIAVWLAGDLHVHLGTTLAEVVAGLAIGGFCGAAVGLSLGRSTALAAILRPVVVAFYSVPLITLVPLLILFFGLGVAPKIILVAVVVFFLLFFNTFSGAQSVDEDLVNSLDVMGASGSERMLKAIVPAATVWIIGGVKVALPYALVAAITGEMLAARSGLGFLLVRGYAQFDMTAVYAALLILTLLGIFLSEVLNRVERWLLRWRHAEE